MSDRTAASLVSIPVVIMLLAGCNLVEADVSLRVIEYDGPDFSPADARHFWTAQMHGDEVTLQAIPKDTMRGPIKTLFLTLEHRPNALPKIRDAWYGPYGGGLGEQVRDGTIEIDTWEIDGLISGVVDVELPRGGVLYDWFYIQPADTLNLIGR